MASSGSNRVSGIAGRNCALPCGCFSKPTRTVPNRSSSCICATDRSTRDEPRVTCNRCHLLSRPYDASRSNALGCLTPASSAAVCLLSILRPTITIKAMAVASTAAPKGVQLKKPNGARPRARRVSSTIMFGDDAIRVIMPLISAATESGISIRFRLRPILLAIANTTGMNMATIAEELMNAPTGSRQHHDERYQARLVTAAGLHHRLTQTMCDTCRDQSFADDGYRGNQEHHRLTETRQRFLYRQHAAQIERQNDEDRHHIGAQASGREQHDGTGQYAEDNQHLVCHRTYSRPSPLAGAGLILFP